MANEFEVQGVANRLWSEETVALAAEERRPAELRSGVLVAALAMCLPAYLLGNGMVAMGLGRGQALVALALGSAAVCVGAVLQGQVGGKYGIPFAVVARASFGVLGARIPVALRALVGCGWFGIQCWLGGLVLLAALRLMVPGLGQGAVWGCFAVFCVASLMASRMHWLADWRLSAAWLVAVGGMLLLSGGGGVAFAGDAGGAQLGFPRMFWFGVTATVGFWAAAVVGSADIARHGGSEKETRAWLTLGVLAGLTVFAVLGVLRHGITWQPAGGPTHVAVRGVSSLVLAGALLLGSSAGLRSLAKDVASLEPEAISVPLGSLLAALVGVAWMPWRWLADPRHYLRGWLPGCAGVLWAVCGVMLVDYFLARRRWLNVEALYMRGGVYEYADGVNGKAMIALGAGIAAGLGGRLAVPLHGLMALAGFLGFGIAGLVYLVLVSGPPVSAVIPPAPLLIPVAEFEGEGA